MKTITRWFYKLFQDWELPAKTGYDDFMPS